MIWYLDQIENSRKHILCIIFYLSSSSLLLTSPWRIHLPFSACHVGNGFYPSSVNQQSWLFFLNAQKVLRSQRVGEDERKYNFTLLVFLKFRHIWSDIYIIWVIRNDFGTYLHSWKISENQEPKDFYKRNPYHFLRIFTYFLKIFYPFFLIIENSYK